MNISKVNEAIEAEIQNGYLGMIGDPNFNRSKEKIFQCLINNQLKRTLGMFEYGKLPKTLSVRSMEKYLQGCGTCLAVEVTEEMIMNEAAKGKAGLYVFPCKAGGILDENYLPTTAIVVSPYFGFSKTFDLTKNEAVYMWNDSLLEGLSKLFSLYASELTDNIMTLHFQEVHNRILTIIKALSEDDKKDAKEFFTSYEDGAFVSLMTEQLMNGINPPDKSEPFKGSANTSIKDTLEARQWLLAHWNIEIGLNDNYNMKRESLNENEIEANSDTLTTLIDDMMKTRKERNMEELYRVFPQYFPDGKPEVRFASSWKRVQKREKNAQIMEDAETKIIKEQADNPQAETENEPTKTEPEPKKEGEE